MRRRVTLRRAVLFAALALVAPLPAFALDGGAAGLGVKTNLNECGVQQTGIVCSVAVTFNRLPNGTHYTARVVKADGSVQDFGRIAEGSDGGRVTVDLSFAYAGSGGYTVSVAAWGRPGEEEEKIAEEEAPEEDPSQEKTPADETSGGEEGKTEQGGQEGDGGAEEAPAAPEEPGQSASGETEATCPPADEGAEAPTGEDGVMLDSQSSEEEPQQCPPPPATPSQTQPELSSSQAPTGS